MKLREQLLRRMEIMQWVLRNQTVFRGKNTVCIPDITQLVVISETHIDLRNTFVKDVLRAMMVDSSQVFCLLTNEISNAPEEIMWPCWILGKKLPLTSKKWIIHTVSLQEIYFNPQLKRDLWAQMCQHENNFKFRSN